VLARELMDGDPSGDMRWALEQYPRQEVTDNLLKKYYWTGGRDGKPYERTPLFNYRYNPVTADLAVVGAFAEVLLAKRDAGGRGIVGMNLLTKIEEPTIHTLYGAMQAGVDVVAMGAGIPRDIPRYIRDMAEGKPIDFPISVRDATKEYFLKFDPARYTDGEELEVARFLMIITSDILARRLKSIDVPADGYIIEEPIAGGHNAPPRDKRAFDVRGQPLYGDKDYANLERMRELDLPFWLAGGYGDHAGLARARQLGAQGVQVGSIFAMAEESGMDPGLKHQMIEQIRSGHDIDVYTDPLASPTGYPFKVAMIEGTMSNPDVYAERERICDLGYLREAVELHRTSRDGGEKVTVVYRCASEPIDDFLEKGGSLEQTIGRKCICNGLLATIAMGQSRGETIEPPIVTIGDAVNDNVRAIEGPITAASIIRSIRGVSHGQTGAQI
jgi:NAD(P)H-dependent flavin oxidoreductase YrpB (nitropropane dioxygenase family)